ncbi:Potassium channel protein [Roseobacter sp. SK209-2-6]|uniref:potassium channel family protein n=1 Tax=Roseobacter sp. SK209-2-6 TaxID=388739 RepID=UPI0000F3F67A|nr:potassium channel family protein [Roseobacter sp. SK209-2-6]EBA17798.1 Potassium channel protein [Roseobacter sp. SK209-2-6]
MRPLRRATIFLSLLIILVSSTVFFHLVEGWSWVDSYFFTVVTISTVGYGNLVPATEIGKIATTILIFSGLGIFAIAIREFAQLQMQKREKQTDWLIAHLGIPPEDADAEEVANQDDQPHESRHKT